MSKYVYIKYRNELHLTKHMQKDTVMIEKQLVPVYWLKDFVCLPEDYLELDNLEDLIEVGDLIKYEYTTMFDGNGTTFRIVDDATIEQIKSGDYSSKDRWIIEIYKHIEKDFIRVCHKGDEGWVID